MSDPEYDAVVIGSGFGGTMAAHALVGEGLDVLMLERGPWVERGSHNWDPDGTLEATGYYSADGRYRSPARGDEGKVGTTACVGGPSVFYGGVSLRYRARDFRPDPEIVRDSGALWPLEYRELRPYYARAERILQVAGEAGSDPTDPPRERPYPQSLPELSPVSRMVAAAARSAGLRPFRLPLAINYGTADGRSPCVRCNTCDTFACAVGAKNDLSAAVLPDLIRRGLELRPLAEAVGLHREGDRVAGVEYEDRRTGVREVAAADQVVLAAGALGSPRLLLASGLEEASPAGGRVGRYLTRHCSAIAFGFFADPPEGGDRFHKQVGIQDYYFGHPRVAEPVGKLGGMQQVQTPSNGVIRSALPDALASLLRPAARRLVGLLVMAEDRPQARNRVELGRGGEGALPPLRVRHGYSDRDLAARGALIEEAKRVLSEAGALFSYVHRIDTFSHALGTVRMGEDPERAPLDPDCRFRGLRNLWVVDGSALPTAGAVNPSLTIAANALRAGERIAAEIGRREGTTAVAAPGDAEVGGR